MLEKFITDFKKSLPEPLRKKLGITIEEDEELESEHSEEDEDFNDEEPTKKGSRDSDEEAPEDDEAAKKKKQISMLIRVVVIAGIAYYGFDEFVMKEDGEATKTEAQIMQEAEEKLQAKRKEREEQRQKAEAEAALQNPATNENGEETLATNDSNNALDNDSTNDFSQSNDNSFGADSNVPPVENINIQEKTEMVDSGSNSNDSINYGFSQDNSNSGALDNSNESESESVTMPSTETTVDNSPAVEQELNSIVSDLNNSSYGQESAGSDSSLFENETPKTNTKLESKIVDSVTETAPPSYDEFGRGLVYNCKDKFWACINQPAYVVCNKNMKWNQAQGKSAECAISAVYGSEEDCVRVQKYNVTMNVATDFCN